MMPSNITLKFKKIQSINSCSRHDDKNDTTINHDGADGGNDEDLESDDINIIIL